MKRVQENSSDISGSNQRSPPPGVTKSEYIQLLRMICADFPIDVLNGILTVLGVQNQEIVDFREFCGGVCACLQYEEFFEQVEWLYKTGASKDASTMDRKLLVKIIEEIKSNSNPNIQVPSDSVIKQTLKEADVGNGKIEFRDFVKAMFRLCIPEELVCATITR
uniref:Tubulin polyglutamylase complex subunit 1-like C-terminal domain-containing protein n=1 Tax=Amorphochlora amoebiformis TaxID=1561963 RepID=A0A7S0DNG6_9EUKA